MKVTGIIAEYNPFHNGHAYQLHKIRENGSDYIVVVMSGDYVQRGTPALFSKYLRAKAALMGGVDLVLELPVFASTASAESFAESAVSILDGLGVVDELCFGAEAADIRKFQDTASILNEEPASYQAVLKDALKSGLSFPAARSLALEKLMPGSQDFLSSPNNILGVEYCRALQKSGSSIKPYIIKRKGSGYHESSINREEHASAAALRKILASENPDFESFKAQVPEVVCPLYENALKNNAFMTCDDFNEMLYYALWNESAESLTRYADVSPELASRIMRLLPQYENYEQFISLLKTKELTHTRISRALLHILLKVTSTPSGMSCVRVLGFRKNSEALLSEIKKRGKLPLLTKLKSTDKLPDPAASASLCLNTHASNLYEGILSQKEKRSFVHEYQRPVIIL